MTPFEKAKKNIKHLADGLAMCNLIQSTFEDVEGMSEEEADLVWTAILSLLDAADALGDPN